MENILYSISVEDAQTEAQERIGRNLTDTELEIVRDKLDWGINESINAVYHAIFEEISKI